VGEEMLEMNATKIFLGFNVAVWLPYGLFCAFQPSYLGEVAGVIGITPTGTTEIRAMYGGLQAGIGVLALVALLHAEHARSVLLTLCCLTGGLFLARTLGFVMDSSGSGYTFGAMGFEFFNTVVACLLFRKESAARA
jgi:hypothetical protein